MISLRELDENLWITLIIVVSFILSSVLKKINPTKFKFFLRLLWNRSSAVKHIFETKKFNYFTALVFLNSALILSLFIYLSASFIPFYYPDNTFTEFITLYGLVILFFGITYLIEKIIAELFEINSLVTYQIRHLSVIKYFSFHLLFPGVLLLKYSDFDTFTVSFIFSLIAVIVIFLGFTNLLFRYRKLYLSEWFYFILYLCSLKIAPYIILYKVIRFF